MTTEPAIRARAAGRVALIVAAAALAACNTATMIVKDRIARDDQDSPIGRAITALDDLPFASAYVRAGDRFEGLVILGSVDAQSVQTWYGHEGLVLQLRDDRVIYSRGLPMDVVEAHPAATSVADESYDCGGGYQYSAPPALYYTRVRGMAEFGAELRLGLSCRVEMIITPGYVGDALRVDEAYRLPPHPDPQRRSKWIHPHTGHLLRLDYAEHPLAPEISITWLRPAAPR